MTKKTDSEELKEKTKKMTCGIIMPIAPHPDYPTEHWKDVLGILNEAIYETEFEPKLVSDDVAIGLIHDRIITNIYNNEIVVCDVSSKNPNVMFELGLRLAFDKPTIIIKDETTGYSFDTGVIEHISYPSSLRFNQIVKFKKELVKRINATYNKSKEEPDFSPFLKSFGKTITPSSFQQVEIPEGKYILNQLDALRHDIQSIRIEQQRNSFEQRSYIYDITNNKKNNNILNSVLNKYSIRNLKVERLLNDNTLLSSINKELMMNGIELSNSELIELLSNYYEKSITKV